MSTRTQKKSVRKEVQRIYKKFRTSTWLRLLLAGLREKSHIPEHYQD